MTLRVQITLNPTADSEDQIVNTWWAIVDVSSTPLAAATAFVADLNTFYQAVDLWFSSAFNGQVPRVKVFDMDEPEPRQPIYETNLTALSVTGTSVGVRELACCLSFRATYASGSSPARRRGRIYLGPLRADAVNDTTGKISSSVTSAINTAADALLTASLADADYRWAVFSRADNTARIVVAGWVDNEFDIQRRRGTAATSRLEFS